MHDPLANADLASLLGSPTLTRREVLVTSLAAGFALAVQPVSADTITTDAEGLTAGEVRIPARDGEIPGYRAMPAQGTSFPIVLVVQEIFGVHEHIRDVCRRFAKQGYVAVAPELYARQGDVSKISDWKQIMSEVVAKVPDAQVMADLDAAAAWAGQSSKGDKTKVAVTDRDEQVAVCRVVLSQRVAREAADLGARAVLPGGDRGVRQEAVGPALRWRTWMERDLGGSCRVRSRRRRRPS